MLVSYMLHTLCDMLHTCL